MKLRYLYFVALAAVLVSCASLPERQSEQEAMLIIPVEITTMEQTIPKVFAALETDSGELIDLAFGNNFIAIDTNSTFFVQAYIAREDKRQPREEWGEIIDINQEFKLKAGTVYVLPYKVRFYPAAIPGRISLGSNEPMIRLGGELLEFTEEDMELFLEDIQSQDNYSQWNEIKVVSSMEVVNP